jgi:hypothetical protein
MKHFGPSDETSRLLAALVRSPERELGGMTEQEAEDMLWLSRPNPEKVVAPISREPLAAILSEDVGSVTSGNGAAIRSSSELLHICRK